MKLVWKIGTLLVILFVGLKFGISQSVNVSNTVNGKELPIYSVETDDKKVALSFDAAWGDGYSRY